MTRLRATPPWCTQELLQHTWIGAPESKLRARDLGGTKEKIKEFNARKKLKAGVKTVMAANKMAKSVNAFASAARERKGSNITKGSSIDKLMAAAAVKSKAAGSGSGLAAPGFPMNKKAQESGRYVPREG